MLQMRKQRLRAGKQPRGHSPSGLSGSTAAPAAFPSLCLGPQCPLTPDTLGLAFSRTSPGCRHRGVPLKSWGAGVDNGAVRARGRKSQVTGKRGGAPNLGDPGAQCPRAWLSSRRPLLCSEEPVPGLQPAEDQHGQGHSWPQDEFLEGRGCQTEKRQSGLSHAGWRCWLGTHCQGGMWQPESTQSSRPHPDTLQGPALTSPGPSLRWRGKVEL